MTDTLERREATDEMVQAAIDALAERKLIAVPKDIRIVWRAMNDAALATTPAPREKLEALQPLCAEIVQWWDSGVLRGDLLKDHGSRLVSSSRADEHDFIRQAERDVVNKVIRLVATLNRLSGGRVMADNARAMPSAPAARERSRAVSALRTQRDEVIEECARVAERYGVPVGAGDGSTYISSASPIEIATAIRNLKSQDEPR